MIVGINESTHIQGELNRIMGLGARLAEDKDRVLCEDTRIGKKTRMGDLLEGITDETMRNQTAILLNNTYEYFNSLDESTKLINIGDFEKYAFPMVRAIFPNLAAHNWASVQPMYGDISLVFFMKFVYAMTKGSAVAGTDIIENPNRFYGSEDIDEEVVATGDGATTTKGSATLTYTPIKPGTLVLTATISGVAAEITDDGNGALIGDIGAGTNTINYSTGAVVVDWTAAPDALTEITAAYTYDSEGSDTIAELDMVLTAAPVTARTHKLRTKWSLEAAQKLRNMHGLEAEIEQVAAISNNQKFEIDQTIAADLQALAGLSVAAWSKSPGTGVSYTEHKLSFVDKLTEASNLIFNTTQLATGTFLICDINTASIVETLPGFVGMPKPPGTRGVYKCGMLNGVWEIWKDPNRTANTFLMGYRGTAMYEVGYIFAPYIMGYTTNTIMLDDFRGRKAIMSRYGKKKVNGNFYCAGTITA